MFIISILWVDHDEYNVACETQMVANTPEEVRELTNAFVESHWEEDMDGIEMDECDDPYSAFWQDTDYWLFTTEIPGVRVSHYE